MKWRSIRRPASRGPCTSRRVDDAGPVINPLVVHGQTQGGIAQAWVGAFNEEMV